MQLEIQTTVGSFKIQSLRFLLKFFRISRSELSTLVVGVRPAVY